MIKFPSLKNGKKKAKKYVHQFGGINNSGNYRDGECESCENLDADALPCLKAGRGSVSENIPADDLLYADGAARVVTQESGNVILYYRPEKDGTNWFTYAIELTPGKKEIASAGGKVIVMPDKRMINLADKYPAWRTIEKEVSYPQQAARLYGSYMVFKTDANFTTFKNSFKVGDVISFSGGYYDGNETADYWMDKKMIIREISNQSERKVTFDPYTFDDTNANETTACTIKKVMPELTHLCSWNDRVWGVSADGKIYASKYQDPTNFEYFDLSSADSFTLEAGIGGAFTGSCATGNYIAFFRENKIHRITGTKPSNYRHTVIKQNGVMRGSERSLAVINDIVYYEGKNGIYAFDGGEARLVSEKLGDFVHSLGVGAARGDEYYISVKNGTGSFDLFRYHTRKGIWLKDGQEQYLSAVSFLGDMYYVNSEKKIYKISDKKATRDFETTLRAFEADFAEKKGFMRICVGYTKNQSGYIECSVSYNDKPFEKVATLEGGTDAVGEIRLTPNRGDSIRIKLHGSSDAVIKYIMREYHTHNTAL